jgi:putative membrane protein
MFWYDHDLTAWGWVGMALGMIAFWALLIAVGLWLVRSSGRDDRAAGQRPDPQQLLAERFARGEIEEVEYHDRLATLRGEKKPVMRS